MSETTSTPPEPLDLAAIRAEVASLTEDPEFERSLHIGGVEQDLARFVLDRVPALLAALDAARAETELYRRKEVTLANELSRARQDAAEFCGQRDEARAALAALREQYRDLATYRTTHANLGLCPEGPDDPARDPDCPVCTALAAAPSETEEGR